MKPAAPLALLTAAAFLTTGCKGDTKYKDTPETLAKLDNCTKQLAEKDKLIQMNADQIADLERKAAAPGEIVVTIEGDTLVVQPSRGGATRPIDDKAAAAISKDFYDQVAKSRGAIQKCYEQALKKDSGLQSRTVTLKVSASFAATGAFLRTSFNPSISDTFDNCLRGVAGRWKLKPAPQAMTFQAQVSLVPA